MVFRIGNTEEIQQCEPTPVPAQLPSIPTHTSFDVNFLTVEEEIAVIRFFHHIDSAVMGRWTINLPMYLDGDHVGHSLAENPWDRGNLQHLFSHIWDRLADQPALDTLNLRDRQPHPRSSQGKPNVV